MKRKNNQVSQYLPKSSNSTPFKNPIASAISGFIIFLVANFILSFLGALIAAKNSDPNILVSFISTISMTVSAILGSIVSAKLSKDSYITSSLTFLAAVTLAILIMTVINMKSRESIPFWQSMLLKLPVALGGIFGSFIGSRKKKSKSLYEKYK